MPDDPELTNASPGESADGRNLRRMRNREAVVETALSLLQGGVDEPSIEQITAGSGVSQRSVFRYFDSVEDLRAAVIGRYYEQLEDVVGLPDDEAPLGCRVRRLVENRLFLYNGHGTLARIARQRERSVPAVADVLKRTRRRLNLQVRRQLAPELSAMATDDADRVQAMITALISFESWDLLHRADERSDQWIADSWCQALPRLLIA